MPPAGHVGYLSEQLMKAETCCAIRCTHGSLPLIACPLKSCQRRLALDRWLQAAAACLQAALRAVYMDKVPVYHTVLLLNTFHGRALLRSALPA